MTCSRAPSGSTTGRCSSPTCCRTARSATTTCAAPRACAPSTPGCARRSPRTARGTNSRATCCSRPATAWRSREIGYYVTSSARSGNVEESELPDSRGAGLSRHAHRLRALPQSSAREIHAGRLLPLRRVLLARLAQARRTRERRDRRWCSTSREEDESAAAARRDASRSSSEAHALAQGFGEEPGAEEAQKQVAERKRQLDEAAEAARRDARPRCPA